MTLRTFVALYLCLALGCSAAEEDSGPPPSGERIRYSIQVTNPTQRVLPRAQLWLPSPSPQATSQRLSAVEVTQPHRIVGTAHGNQQIYLEFTDVPVSFDEKIDVDAWIEFGAEASGMSADVHPDYLAPGPGVESDAPSIRQRATGLAHEDVAGTAAAILAWVGELEIEAPPPADEQAPAATALPPPAPGDERLPQRGARHVLETQSGGEADRLMLAVALLRASGIPARMVVGFSAEEGVSLSAEHIGIWVEYVIDDVWQRGLLDEPSEGPGIRVVALKVIDDPAAIPRGREFAALHEAVGLRAELVN